MFTLIATEFSTLHWVIVLIILMALMGRLPKYFPALIRPSELSIRAIGAFLAASYCWLLHKTQKRTPTALRKRF